MLWSDLVLCRYLAKRLVVYETTLANQPQVKGTLPSARTCRCRCRCRCRCSSTCNQGLWLLGITGKVSLTCFKSVSPFDNILIVLNSDNRWDAILNYKSRKISPRNCSQCLPVFAGCCSGSAPGSVSGFYISPFRTGWLNDNRQQQPFWGLTRILKRLSAETFSVYGPSCSLRLLIHRGHTFRPRESHLPQLRSWQMQF